MVADLILKNDPAGAATEQFLGGASLSKAAIWADCAKGTCHRLLSADEQTYVVALGT
jgi:hypothetical protein